MADNILLPLLPPPLCVLFKLNLFSLFPWAHAIRPLRSHFVFLAAQVAYRAWGPLSPCYKLIQSVIFGHIRNGFKGGFFFLVLVIFFFSLEGVHHANILKGSWGFSGYVILMRGQSTCVWGASVTSCWWIRKWPADYSFSSSREKKRNVGRVVCVILSWRMAGHNIYSERSLNKLESPLLLLPPFHLSLSSSLHSLCERFMLKTWLYGQMISNQRLGKRETKHFFL